MEVRTPEILVIAAMKEEVSNFISDDALMVLELRPSPTAPDQSKVKQCRWYWEPAEYRGRVGVWVCGVGKKRASRSIRQALTVVKPGQVIIAGISGSLSPELNICDLIIPQSVFNGDVPDAPEKVFDSNLIQEMMSIMLKFGTDIRSGTAVCCNRMIDKKADKDLLHKHFEADCVDMESYHLLRVLQESKVSTAMIRIVSDLADESLGLDFSKLPTSRLALKLYFLTHPLIYLAFRATRKKALAAMERLNLVLQTILQDKIVSS